VFLIVFGSARADQPNVVIIMADDMGYSDLGCFGGEIRTPSIDALAHDGLRFTNFYSENMCWVSRAAMLTGVYHKTSMVDKQLHPRCPTIAETLRGCGYQTCMSGKWHLAGKSSESYPVDRGFGDFYGILGGAASFFAPYGLRRNRTNVEDEANKDPSYYLTHRISDEAVRMIETADSGKPLFLYVAYTAAHWPLHAPEEDVEAYRGSYTMGWDKLRQQRLQRMKSLGIVPDSMSLSPRHKAVPAWDDEKHQAWQQRRMEVYAAQVTAMDRGIGRIVKALQESGRFDDTLMLFTVDYGGCHVEYDPDRKGTFLPEKTRDGRPVRPGNLPHIMPGGEDTYQSYGHGWANASNTPYRLFKQHDHEGGIRTPMIAHWPAGITTTGKLVPTVSHLIDLLPTLLELTGSEVPETINGKPPIAMDGISLATAFKGESLAGHETLFFHHSKGKAIRHQQWKLVAIGKENWELYDLRADPLELDNLADSMPAKAEELAAMWKAESDRLARQAQQR
jgi:arylsulfatase A-like enzyme